MDAFNGEFALRQDKKPHFLFWGTKWLNANPDCGPSNCSYFTWDTLEGSDFGTYDIFLIDEYYLTHEQPGDSELIRLCKKNRPDYFVLVWWPGGPSHFNPAFETLYTIRKNLGIPIIALWLDTWADWIVELVEKMLPLVDIAVVTDSIKHFEKTFHPEKYLELLAISDIKVFFDPGLERDIDISFNGRVTNKPDRIAGIKALQANGINVLKTGGQLESRLCLEEYARVYMQSKITLNFSRSGEKLTRKGRLIEATLCGAMLLESENPETSKWFEPMIDYVPFRDEKDLIDKARYYLQHHSERIEIAQNGRRKAIELSKPENFWGRIINKLKFERLFDDMGSLRLLISSFLESEQIEKANFYMNRLITNYPHLANQLPLFLLQQGVAKLHDRELDKALVYLNRAKEISPCLPNLEFARATVFAQLGKLASAKEACEAELSLNADDHSARTFLERLNLAMKGIPC
jgi:tetratricopeptide (TPR) repeat protein